mmetsp:Transcript_6892/g.20018  ORF Transcript_6892/g.20018 Transcript_6892/m.20018 type:complete len:212 (-) Transcript_6892:361-996(-)
MRVAAAAAEEEEEAAPAGPWRRAVSSFPSGGTAALESAPLRVERVPSPPLRVPPRARRATRPLPARAQTPGPPRGKRRAAAASAQTSPRRVRPAKDPPPSPLRPSPPEATRRGLAPPRPHPPVSRRGRAWRRRRRLHLWRARRLGYPPRAALGSPAQAPGPPRTPPRPLRPRRRAKWRRTAPRRHCCQQSAAPKRSGWGKRLQRDPVTGRA